MHKKKKREVKRDQIRGQIKKRNQRKSGERRQLKGARKRWMVQDAKKGGRKGGGGGG